MRLRSSATAVIFAAFVVSIGFAGIPSDALADDPNFLAVGGGIFDFNHSQVGQGRIELRFADNFLYLKPMLGLMVTTDKAVYGYGGLRLDLYFFGGRFVVTPNGAIGGYHRGDGINLGETLEFKTGAEFAYRFEDHSRLAIALDHISNAGIAKHNPGANNVLIFYSYPLGPMM